MTRLAPLWQQNSLYPARTDRVLINTVWPTAVVSGGAPTVQTGTMNVQIAAGIAAVPLTAGNYSALCRWDATEVVTLTAGPPSGQSRIDLVTLQVRDAVLDAGANNDFVFLPVTGTATTGTPVAPATPNNALVVCQVLIPGAAANLNGATITDRRVPLSNLSSAAAGLVPNGYAQITTQSPSVGQTATPVTGMGVNVTTFAGRRYKVTMAGTVVQTAGAASMVRPAIYMDGAKVAGIFQGTPQGSAFTGFCLVAMLWPAAGVHNFTLYLSIDAGTVAVYAEAAAPTFVLVEDLGG